MPENLLSVYIQVVVLRSLVLIILEILWITSDDLWKTFIEQQQKKHSSSVEQRALIYLCILIFFEKKKKKRIKKTEIG